MRWTVFFLLMTLGPSGAEDLSAKIKVGMTRAQVEKNFYADGGISVPFRMERYILRTNGGGPKVTKLTLQFKPAGMSLEVYLLGKWAAPQQKPGDVLMKMSAPYQELPNYD